MVRNQLGLMGKLPLPSLGPDLGSGHGLTTALEHPIFSVMNAPMSSRSIPFMPDKSAGIWQFASTPMIGCPQVFHSLDLSLDSFLFGNPSGSILDALQTNQAFPPLSEKFARIVEGVLVNPSGPGAIALGDRLCTLLVMLERGAPIV